LLAPGPVHSAIFNDPFAGVIKPETQGFVDTMRSLLSQHGIGPDAFAARVFDAIDRGEYWIVPQPEALDPQLERRNEMLRTRRAPDLGMMA